MREGPVIQFRYGVSVFVSWLFFVAGWGILPAFDWSEPGAGLLVACFHVVILTGVYCCTILLGYLSLLWLWTRRKWRTAPLIIVFPLFSLGLFAINAADLRYPWDSETRFEKGLGAALPKGVTEFRSYHTGGGLRPYLDLYYIEGSEETLTSVVDGFTCRMEANYEVTTWYSIPSFGDPPSGWPSPVEWEMPTLYRCHRDFSHHATFLFDGEKRRLYIIVDEGYRRTPRFRRGLPN